jgi:hypothetical protein
MLPTGEYSSEDYMHIRGYSSTAMDRTWQSAEYDICFVPYHQEVLRAHESHFCPRVIAEDRGFQSDVSNIQTETEQHVSDIQTETEQHSNVFIKI